MRKLKLASSTLAPLLIVFAMTGCATAKKNDEPGVDYCSTARAIYVSKNDGLTDGTARQVLEHNLTGQKLCGWGRASK